MLALLSRFFLQAASRGLLWLEEGGDEEELVLARESSSDIPVRIREEAKPEAADAKSTYCMTFTGKLNPSFLKTDFLKLLLMSKMSTSFLQMSVLYRET